MILVYPLLVVLLGVGFQLLHRRRHGPQAQALDLGQAFLAIVLVYGLVPGIGFLLAHLGIGQMVDARLAAGYEVDQVEYVQAMHLSFAASFALVYLWLRKPGLPRHEHRDTAAKPARWLVGLAIGLALLLPLVGWVWGSETDNDYISSYTALREAPLIVQQLYGVLSQMQFSATVAAIVYLVAARPDKHVWVAALLILNLLAATVAGGSRSLAFLSFFAYIVAISIYVPGMTMRRVGSMAVPALLLFMLAGLLRDQNPDASYLNLFQTGEFTALFINAMDLKARVDEGLADEVRFAFYLVDVIRLIPSQLLGGVKLDPAQWYAATFYEDYFDAGGGFAFGLMAECMAGFGIPEAALRGALLAGVFAGLSNHLLLGCSSVKRVFVYVWLVTLSYQSWRDTTFSLGVRALYQLLPVLVLLAVIGEGRIRRPRRTAGASA